MKVYPVPFSAKEEDKLIFNLSTKEALIIGVSIVVGLFAAGIGSVALHSQMLFCLPLGLPFIFAGAVLALKRLNISGCEMTAGDYILYRYSFKQRNRHYLAQRGKEGENKWYF